VESFEGEEFLLLNAGVGGIIAQQSVLNAVIKHPTTLSHPTRTPTFIGAATTLQKASMMLLPLLR
jgi:hypothetical protein